MSTTSTKSKTTTKTQTQTQTQTQTYAEAVEASRQRYRDAQAEHGENVSLLAAARKQYDELGSRLAAGDRSALDERTGLKDRIADLELLAAGSERKVKAAERGLLAEDTRLADVLAPVLSKLLDGIPLEVVNVTPNPAAVSVPSVYIVQTKATEENTLRGTVSGKVTVLYHRTQHHAPLNPDAFERIAGESFTYCTTRDHTRQEQAHTVDVLDVEVQAAFEEIPAIVASSRGGLTLSNLHRNLPREIEGGSVMGQTDWTGKTRQVPTITATAEPARQVSDKTDAEGVRRREVDMPITARPSKGSPWTPGEVYEQTARAVEALVGRPFTDLGRISGAEVVQSEPLGKSGYALTVRLTFACKPLEG